jgi:polyisoprenoid-binding protein YceI
MRHSLRLALCLSAALSLGLGGAATAAAARKPGPAPAAGARSAAPAWSVDKTNSKIRFRSTFGGTAFEGGVSRWDAQIHFDPSNLAGSKAVVSVDLASATSGDADRDQTLPTADWFDVAKYPRATFTSTAIKALGGGRYQATGALNLKGVTRPVTLPFTLTITGDTARMQGQVVLNRSQFGVGQGQFAGAETVPFEVTVPITVVAKRAG